MLTAHRHLHNGESTTTRVGRGGTNPAAALACEPMWLMRICHIRYAI
jgi:hypothetical protein